MFHKAESSSNHNFLLFLNFFFWKLIFFPTFLIGWFWDVVYACNNYYFYEWSTGIWRKGIDKKDPQLWMKVQSEAGYIGRLIKAALHGTALVIIKDQTTVIGAMLGSGGSLGETYQIVENFHNDIRDYAVIGPNEDKLLLLSSDGLLKMFKFDIIDQHTETVFKTQIKTIESRREYTTALAVCSQSRFVAIPTQYRSSVTGQFLCSRVLVYELSGSSIILRSTLDFFEESLHRFYAVSWSGYLKNRYLVLSAFSCSEPSVLVSLRYDTNERVLEELGDLRKSLNVKVPLKYVKVGGEMYTSDEKGRIINARYF